MNINNNPQKDLEITQEEMAHLAYRVLILLSFKDTDTQNLRFLLNLLGVRTLDDKKNILQEIFRLIRMGVLYVPKGLPQLIEQGPRFNVDHLNNIEDLNLCLLCPQEKLIQEIQKEIRKLK
ncbi:MAG: hypothetical protein JSV04_15140 [Candidatus Heimdallarchaeota archaeon]|nr:MAG: hypothetical protein JSV04_15140 [Candidatus Heimdallarchaeota archaeon]